MRLMTIKRNRWKEAFSNYLTLRCKIASTRMFSMKKTGSKFYPKFFTIQNTQVLCVFCWKIFYFFNQRPSVWQEILDSRLTFFLWQFEFYKCQSIQFQTFSQQLKLWWNFTINLIHPFPKRSFQKSFIWGYLFHLSLYLCQKAGSAEISAVIPFLFPFCSRDPLKVQS